MIVVTDIGAGARLALVGGITAEVLENMGDGEWLRVRLLTVPDGKGEAGAEELCHATDVVEVL
ncbi:MAG: hypothetical protein AB7F35_07615 [Acetobacteraceae bacterium]